MDIFYYFLTIVSATVMLCQMISAGAIDTNWSPDENGVCEFESHRLNCSLSDGGKLPFLISGARDYNNYKRKIEAVMFSCQRNSSDVFNISLTNSIFGETFRASYFSFDFKNCNFNLPPDLFDHDVSYEYYDETRAAKYYLMFHLAHRSFIPNLSFDDPSIAIEIAYYRGELSKLKTALKYTTAVKLRLTLEVRTTLPNRFFTDITSLVELEVRCISQCESLTFWGLPVGLAKLNLTAEVLVSKSIYEIGHIDSVLIFGPLTLLHDGCFNSIGSIKRLYLAVNHDAFQGQTFHNTTSIEGLYLTVYKHEGPNCGRTSVECPLRFDFGATKIRYMSIIMNGAIFVLPSSDTFGLLQLRVLEIQITLVQYPTDQWADGNFVQGALKDIEELNLIVGTAGIYRENKIHSITCLPLNLTNSILKSITYSRDPGDRNPICDSSWLTLPKTTHNLIFKYSAKAERINYPLILRSPAVAGASVKLFLKQEGPSASVHLQVVHCTCSISWLKQLVDCGAVHVDTNFSWATMWLDLPCSFDRSMTVEQFLNSTMCCNSTDPPTLNNEPNMPMRCTEFLPIPPELLYFNHTDLPQCRGFHWEFNPCNVAAFYSKYIMDKAKNENSPFANDDNFNTATHSWMMVAIILLIINVFLIIVALTVACCCCWSKRSSIEAQ